MLKVIANNGNKQDSFGSLGGSLVLRDPRQIMGDNYPYRHSPPPPYITHREIPPEGNRQGV